jgi:peroxiredoxin
MLKHAMKSLAIATFTTALAASAAFAEVGPGEKAPDFTAQAADGSTVTLSALKGKVVVLDWANYGCPFDHMHYSSGNLPKLQKKYAGKGVVWLSIMSSAKGKEGYYTQNELKDQDTKNNNHATHVLMDSDGKIGHLYEAKTTPHMFVIDAKGIVQYNGAIDSVPSTDQESLTRATPYAANAIDAVLAGKTPEPAFIPPYGCSVKY